MNYLAATIVEHRLQKKMKMNRIPDINVQLKLRNKMLLYPTLYDGCNHLSMMEPKYLRKRGSMPSFQRYAWAQKSRYQVFDV